MRKKLTNTILFLAVLAAAVILTIYVGQNAVSVLVYNFIFLGIMVLLYLAGLFGGMFRMNNIAAAIEEATETLTEVFKKSGKADTKNLTYLNGIFSHKYLDKKMDNFTGNISQSQEGIGDLEEYINEEELDNHIHKRLLDMVPDIFTSLGILGTFVGLVWGLRNFQPTDYEAMTSSVSALVDGIKVAHRLGRAPAQARKKRGAVKIELHLVRTFKKGRQTGERGQKGVIVRFEGQGGLLGDGVHDPALINEQTALRRADDEPGGMFYFIARRGQELEKGVRVVVLPLEDGTHLPFEHVPESHRCLCCVGWRMLRRCCRAAGACVAVRIHRERIRKDAAVRQGAAVPRLSGKASRPAGDRTRPPS